MTISDMHLMWSGGENPDYGDLISKLYISNIEFHDADSISWLRSAAVDDFPYYASSVGYDGEVFKEQLITSELAGVFLCLKLC